jgi:bZIP-type transcription factor MBZ1
MTGPNQSAESLDALLDFSEYDAISAYQSPSLSPAAAGKTPFARPASAVTTPTIPTNSRPLTGPSHQYDLYKQQTGIVPGALASTLAVNQSNSHISGYNYDLDYSLNGLSPENDLFDFNTAPSQASMSMSEMEMDFESPTAEPSFFFPETTVNPNNIASQQSPSIASQSSNASRVWPGMHSQQAALAKAQAQQRQQQQLIQQQRQQQQQQQAKPRSKSGQPTDPIVEQKITQLLNSMRAKPMQADAQGNSPLLQLPRTKKDEEEMDEDERLLASEEGKKLSSKERRQLRNKVSARAFRSRRKGK